ncbi:hypothetical protein RND81_04G164800 [Saponaria officinalis]|uniref:DCD domain-containing protein n=1 Tax=Saponaria officinalis TaxID=3572 RepID=A0AAW1LLN7_SAPOF
MVGTRGKGTRSKSKGLALVPDEPEPLKIIYGGEAADGELLTTVDGKLADGPESEEVKIEILNSEDVPVLGGRHEEQQMEDAMRDEEGFEICYAIAKEDMAVLPDLDEGDKFEGGVSYGVHAVSNMDVENNNEGKNEAEIENDTSNIVEAYYIENCDDTTNEQEPKADEEGPTEEEGKACDVNAWVTYANEGLAASEHVQVAENMDNNEEGMMLIAEEPVSTHAENGDETIKEKVSCGNEVKDVAEKVIRPKKKIVRKKLIKKKISLGKAVTALQPSDKNEGSGVSCKAGTSNDSKPLCVEDNQATGEAGKLNNTENVKDGEKMKGKALVKKRNIIKKKKLQGLSGVQTSNAEQKPEPTGDEPPSDKNEGSGVQTGDAEQKPKPTDDEPPSDKIEGSNVSCKAGTSDDSKPLDVEDNQATGEAGKLTNTESVKDEEKGKGEALVKNLNIIKKTKPQGLSGVQTGNAELKPNPTDDEPPNKENQIIEQEIKNEEAAKSKGKRIRLRKRKNKNVVKGGTQDVNSKNVDKPESSKNGKLSKKTESMGMIFMCSSETKKDCYKYQVFGLPAGKKDIVSKIYKGMRLFLFDVDLKMLYGIYKAAGPGSSNIEPRAFKSKFPSQVRFSVLEDCLPIAEEKFKKIIKDNYYSRNKFDCQLNSVQVKNLCKLFNETTKKSAAIRGGQRHRAVALASTRVDRKRKRTEDTRRVAPGAVSSRERERRRRGPEQVRHVHVVRNEEDMRRAPVLRSQEDMRHALVVRGQEETRLAPVAIDERYRRPVVVYEREAYLPPIASSSLYQPLRAEDPSVTRIYSYERDPGVATYRRDSAVDYRDLGITAPRHFAERSLPDAYATYREPHVYREPAPDTATRHYDYLSTEGRYAEYYRSDDHRPPLPLHRRY